MIRGRVAQLEAPTGGVLFGHDVEFSGLSTDTRTLAEGELFIALRGDNFDGHEFIEPARDRGAAAAVCERIVVPGLPSLVVADTRRALGLVSRHWRRSLQPPLVAVTGSNGKTTVKEMLASILRIGGRTLATRGNLNNDIGVPLTLARLSAADRYAVIEMGANHAGEIAWLTEIAEPDVAVVTNAGPAHLEGFGSVEGVARAKGEVFLGLGPDAVAVINGDDAYAPLWRDFAGIRRVLEFGMRPGAAVCCRDAGTDGGMTLSTPLGDCRVRLPVPGRHNRMNALAAAAAAVALHVGLDDIVAGLERFRPVQGRLHVARTEVGAMLVDDTYNANPASLAAGLAVLQDYPGEHWLVLGDMAELGPDASALHADAGRAARASGVRRLYTLGTHSEEAARAFGTGGRHFRDREELVEALRRDLQAGVTLLVKGSRSMAMDRVCAALGATGADGGAH